MKKDIYILGISESHNSTAALVKNGKLIACASEERFSKHKTHMGFPKRSIKYVLKEAGITTKDLDRVVSSFQNSAMYTLYEIDEKSSNNIEDSGDILKSLVGNFSPIFNKISYSFSFLRKSRSALFSLYYPITQIFIKEPRIRYIQNKLKIPKEKIIFAPHHNCHVYASYAFRTKKVAAEPTLILTLDGEGDKYCATVGIFKKGKYKRISTTPNFRSIGKLYQAMTEYLGMKPNEHEYKLMGMAPYSEEKRAKMVYEILKPLIWFGDDLVFHSKMDDRLFYYFIRDNLEKFRFDYLSAGLQMFTEELVIDWVKKSLKKTHTKNLILGGGVFMNVKVNKLITELPKVEHVSFCPSAGDESTAVGAAFYGYELEKQGTTDLSLEIDPIGPLYLGPKFTENDFNKALSKKGREKNFETTKPKNIERKIAELVAKGEVVATMFGRMEFGARALGNRSILAHPKNITIVNVLNQKIKSRDFWMPFASSMKREAESKYIINPKSIYAPYMMLAFDTTEQGKRTILAASHPNDFTTRPQVVDKKWNQTYWNIINEFEKITGIGCVLNTSFNLHGDPIVCDPEDALRTMEGSELNWLATETLLIKKI